MFQGYLQLPWWAYVIVALIFTHITIVSVTIFLHRHQSHRALELHPAVSHFFRFWLWLTTGMVTREWAAIHRKHHAKVETPEDPHSPRQHGINKVLWRGVSLYHQEAKNTQTMENYGHGTPDDWIEHNLYTRHNYLGIVILLALDALIFGIIPGSLIWITQIAWIPFWAAGVINGLGHFWGYRNYEVGDASTNISPWGILIGGEELHNNHHTFASSAKLSSKWWEFDIGWMYIRSLEIFGLARVKKIPPELAYRTDKQQIDLETVKAVITNRFQVMANFAREVLGRVHKEELQKADRESRRLLKHARRLMVRETKLLDPASCDWLQKALDRYQNLRTVYVMKQKLQDIWQRSTATHEYLVHALQDWCREAEATGIQALREFSLNMRTYTLARTSV